MTKQLDLEYRDGEDIHIKIKLKERKNLKVLKKLTKFAESFFEQEPAKPEQKPVKVEQTVKKPEQKEILKQTASKVLWNSRFKKVYDYLLKNPKSTPGEAYTEITGKVWGGSNSRLWKAWCKENNINPIFYKIIKKIEENKEKPEVKLPIKKSYEMTKKELATHYDINKKKKEVKKERKKEYIPADKFEAILYYVTVKGIKLRKAWKMVMDKIDNNYTVLFWQSGRDFDIGEYSKDMVGNKAVWDKYKEQSRKPLLPFIAQEIKEKIVEEKTEKEKRKSEKEQEFFLDKLKKKRKEPEPEIKPIFMDDEEPEKKGTDFDKVYDTEHDIKKLKKKHNFLLGVIATYSGKPMNTIYKKYCGNLGKEIKYKTFLIKVNELEKADLITKKTTKSGYAGLQQVLFFGKKEDSPNHIIKGKGKLKYKQIIKKDKDYLS